jgi:hypothetical protein
MAGVITDCGDLLTAGISYYNGSIGKSAAIKAGGLALVMVVTQLWLATRA